MDRRTRPLVLEMVAVGVAYYLAARLSLRVSLIEKNVTPLWPPTGIALVVFLLRGRRVWPGVAVAAFLVNEPISTSWVAAAVTALGNTLAPLVAAELLRHVGFHPELDRVRDAIAIVFAAALASMAISATIGAGTLVLSNAIPASDFPSAWAVWWTGDAMGVLVVAPFLLSLLLWRRGDRTSWGRRAEAAFLFLLLTTVSLLVTGTHVNLLFLTLPLLGWAAWRFQQRGSAPAALVVAGIATWAAAHGWGPFAEGTLFKKMLTLQAFNATVAFTSFFFSALVTERMRSRTALEKAAADLEERVRLRTAELRTRQKQLTEAQQVARIGSWEWLIEEDRVTWSDEMYRIHGYRPQAFPVTFDKAVELVVAEDLERIRGNVAKALSGARGSTLPANEYRIVRRDGAERVLLGRGRLERGSDGKPVRLVGTVQDITEDKRAEREHRIAESLQRSLLPDRLPEIPGLSLAARYVPATSDMEVGGDWYDVVVLPGGDVGVAIGDVAGHGLRAASVMGQLRMALRAYAVEESSPAGVLARLHQLVRALALPEMATVVYLIFDLDTSVVTFANAGHPPPLLIGEDGERRYLEDSLAPPLGATPSTSLFLDARAAIPPGSTLLLFTDGLIERRGVPLLHSLAKLKDEVSTTGEDLDVLCDHILSSLVEGEVGDDIALVALRPVRFADTPVHFRVPAEPRSLAPIRHTLRRWLRELDADRQEAYEILVASGEACANAIQHPYGLRDGFLEMDVAMVDGQVEIVVQDSGSWRSSSPPGGGHGLSLMRALMDSVEVTSGPDGTRVRMRRRIGSKVAGERAGAR